MATVPEVRSLVNQNVRNYPVSAFQDMRMNVILNLILDLLTGGGGGGGTSGGATKVTSANFIDATNCPLTQFNGDNLVIFFNDVNRFLDVGTDFNLYPGGGFTILIPGFNSASATFTFYVWIQV